MSWLREGLVVVSLVSDQQLVKGARYIVRRTESRGPGFLSYTVAWLVPADAPHTADADALPVVNGTLCLRVEEGA